MGETLVINNAGSQLVPSRNWKRSPNLKAWTGLVVVGLMVVGCTAQQQPAQKKSSSPSVLDVGPAPASYQPSVYAVPAGAAPATPVGYGAAGYLPPTAEPAYVPPPTVDVAPVSEPAPAKTASRTYVVKHGDTLYHIAKVQLGDGSKWKRIAAANPGVTPNSLRVGQKLAMP
jgi:nucleoid-associated protein YgaU